MNNQSISDLILQRSGIQLDIGCGANKQRGWVGLDIRELEGVDIVHDINVHPWPLPDECVLRAIASHLVEHIPPMAIIEGRTRWLFMEFMDEVWRILRVGGQLAISTPHGYSMGFLQDPTHCNPCNEATWAYFAPGHPSGLYNIYKPKPWRIQHLSWSPVANIEVLLEKLPLSTDAVSGFSERIERIGNGLGTDGSAKSAELNGLGTDGSAKSAELNGLGGQG